jgi:hypothetical protein
LQLNINKITNNKEDEKLSLNTSILSDISQNSKNFIPKELLFKESPFKKNSNYTLNYDLRENANGENIQPKPEIFSKFYDSNKINQYYNHEQILFENNLEKEYVQYPSKLESELQKRKNINNEGISNNMNNNFENSEKLKKNSDQVQNQIMSNINGKGGYIDFYNSENFIKPGKDVVPKEIYSIEQPESQEEFMIDDEEDGIEEYGYFYNNIQSENQKLYNLNENYSTIPQNFNLRNNSIVNKKKIKINQNFSNKEFNNNFSDFMGGINNLSNENYPNKFCGHPSSVRNFNPNCMYPNRPQNNFPQYEENSVSIDVNNYNMQVSSHSMNKRINPNYTREKVPQQKNNFTSNNKILNGGWSQNFSNNSMQGINYDYSNTYNHNIQNFNKINFNPNEKEYQPVQVGKNNSQKNNMQQLQFHTPPMHFQNTGENEPIKHKRPLKNNQPQFNPNLENEEFIPLQNFTQNKKKLNRPPNFSELQEEELVKYVHILAREQAGCRFLQKKLEEDPSFADRFLFPAIFDCFLELTIDAFGNYLIQKMMEFMNEENLSKMLNLVCPCMLSLGLNAHGTRVIQKIIECVKSNDLFEIFLNSFNPIMLDLMKDINGNHIIIKFVNTISHPKNSELYIAVTENIVEIATNKHACCAFQKCIDYATLDQRKLLIEKLVDNTYILMSDPYGNYVLQYVIMLDDFNVNHKIAQIFKNNIGYLSKQKFSSNVIEKCFDHCDENTKFLIVKEVCNPKIVVDLLMDMYGNYGKTKYFNF